LSDNFFRLPPLNIRRTILTTVAVIALVLALWLLFRFRIVVLMLFIAIFLSTAMDPAVTWLNERGLPRPAGIGLVYSLLLAFIIAFALIIAPLVAEQGARIASAIPDAYDQVRLTMMQQPNLLLLRLGGELPEDLPINGPGPRTEAEAAAVLTQTWQYLLMGGRVLFGIVLTLIMAFYWTLDGQRIRRGLLLLIPREQRESGRSLLNEMEEMLARYTSGLVFLMSAVGALSFVAYLLIGLPYALLLALVAALFEAVPVIGPGLGAIPAMLIAFSISPLHAVWVLVATLVIQQIENNLLFPRAMNRAMGVHPIVTLLSFVAFGLLFGIAGAVVAIPLAAVVQVVFNRFLLDPEIAVSPEPAGRGRLSVLRYEAQDLLADVRKRVREADTEDQELVSLEDTVEGLALDLEQLLARIGEEEAEAAP
jgi:predicted PurR-regulated permease PerM